MLQSDEVLLVPSIAKKKLLLVFEELIALLENIYMTERYTVEGASLAIKIT